MHRIHTEKLSLAERKQIWQEILKVFDESGGLGSKKFCEQHGIKYDLFAYHLTRHRRKQREQQQPTFIPVEIQRQKEASIHLRWHDMEIDFPADFAPNQLAVIIKTIGAMPC